MSDADKQGKLMSIERNMKELQEVLTYYKSDLYLVPRAKEAEVRKRYAIYNEKLGKYKIAAEKMKLVINKDTEGLKKLKNSYDPERFGALNGETQLLVK